MNIDPLAEDYFDWSPYTYVANNPVLYKDPDGQRIYIYYTDEDGNTMEHEYVFGGTYEGNNQFVKDFYDSMNYILENINNNCQFDLVDLFKIIEIEFANDIIEIDFLIMNIMVSNNILF